MGPWACIPHWNVIYMLKVAVEGGREGIIGEGRKGGTRKGEVIE